MKKQKKFTENTLSKSIQGKKQNMLVIGDVNHTLIRQLSEEMRDEFSINIDILSLFRCYHRNQKYFDKLYSVSLPSVGEPIGRIRTKLNQIFYFKVIKDIVKNLENYDVINIHYLNPLYRYFIKLFRDKTPKLIVTVWGSDFYRVSDKTKIKLKKVFNSCDLITFTNDSMKSDFLSYYGDYHEKVKVCRFGLKVLDVIEEVQSSNDLEELKEEFLRRYNIDSKKKIIACGYNSSTGQQHEQIIKAIQMVNNEKLKDVVFLFPMAYGDENNRLKIELLLKDCTFRYKVISDYLEDKEVAMLRIVSDIMINVQTTDQFSGSMQETLFAGNVLINGGWLPYDSFKDAGAFFLEIKELSELHRKIEECIDDLDGLKLKSKNNREVIWELSSWRKNGKEWYELYQEGV